MSRIWKLATAAIVVVLVIGGLGYHWLTNEFTECYGVFKTREAAERAATAGRHAGLGASVHATGHPDRPDESAVAFDTGETGADAAEYLEAFREIIRREQGVLGHPGDGCVERGSFE